MSSFCSSPVSLRRLPLLFHTLPALCRELHLQCRHRRGLKPLRPRTRRSIAPWRYTILSHKLTSSMQVRLAVDAFRDELTKTRRSPGELFEPRKQLCRELPCARDLRWHRHVLVEHVARRFLKFTRGGISAGGASPRLANIAADHSTITVRVPNNFEQCLKHRRS